MKKYILAAAMSAFCTVLFAQQKPLSRINQFIDLSATIGNNEGSIAGSFVYNRRIGKKRKWEAGFGIRATNYSGTKKDFITAPAGCRVLPLHHL
jgi:hypothetical protein